MTKIKRSRRIFTSKRPKFLSKGIVNNSAIEEVVIIKDYKDFDNEVQNLEKKKLDLFDNAIKSGDPDVIQKASGYFKTGNNITMNGEKIKSMLIDPLDYASSFGYKEKPTRLTYYTLKKMASTPFSALTLNTRITQVMKFCVPQPDEYSIGFKIRMKDRIAEPTIEDQRNMENLTQFLLDGGQNGYSWGRDDFETFVAKLIRDSLTYDQYTFEILENKKGIPQEFIATDAATYRVAYPDLNTADYKDDPLTGQRCLPHIVQIYQGGIENEFYPWELCFGVRRPRTDLMVRSYGYAELEELVNVITSMLYSDEYNRRFFSQGSAPKGMIRISSNHGLSDTALKEFKRAWRMQMAGVYNSWKTPIMEADKMDWIDMSRTNRDMEFSRWQEYLIKIHSALFLMDPSEIGFDIQKGANNTGANFESDKMKRIKYSRDKGLTPLLRNLSKNLNRHLIWRMDDRYELVFIGNDDSEDTALEKAIKELSNFKKIDEVRAKFDLEALGDEAGGNLILNPQYMSWFNNRMLVQGSEQQDQETGQDFGNENESYDLLDEEDNEENEDTEKGIDLENPFEMDLRKFVRELK